MILFINTSSQRLCKYQPTFQLHYDNYIRVIIFQKDSGDLFGKV